MSSYFTEFMQYSEDDLRNLRDEAVRLSLQAESAVIAYHRIEEKLAWEAIWKKIPRKVERYEGMEVGFIRFENGPQEVLFVGLERDLGEILQIVVRHKTKNGKWGKSKTWYGFHRNIRYFVFPESGTRVDKNAGQ